MGFFSQGAGKAAGGGLVVGSCPPTVDDSWYVGAGSGGKHLSTLVLTNLSSSPAVADVSFWGPQGKIDAVDAGGIVVEPFTVRRVDLRDLAAGEADLAVRVERRRGSLAVAALDSSTAVFRGTDALDPTAAPSREQVVAGMPAGSGTRTLMLVNPSTSTARVGVEVIGAEGKVRPQGPGLGQGRRRPVHEVTVPKSAGSDGAALRLRSDQPVAASVRVAPEHEGPCRRRGRRRCSTAPRSCRSTSASAPRPRSSSSPRRVVRAGCVSRRSTSRCAVRPPPTSRSRPTPRRPSTWVPTKVLDAKDVAYVVVRADGGVVGAATYRRGSGIASLGLIEAPVTVLGPQVRPDRLGSAQRGSMSSGDICQTSARRSSRTCQTASSSWIESAHRWLIGSRYSTMRDVPSRSRRCWWERRRTIRRQQRGFLDDDVDRVGLGGEVLVQGRQDALDEHVELLARGAVRRARCRATAGRAAPSGRGRRDRAGRACVRAADR